MDPIDGTRDFLRDLPTWSNLIALEVDGEVVLGVCNLVLTLTAFPDLAPVPFADRMIDYMSGYWAVRSMGVSGGRKPRDSDSRSRGCQGARAGRIWLRWGVVRRASSFSATSGLILAAR